MRKAMLAGLLAFAASLGTSSSVKPFSRQFFFVAPFYGALQNEGHSTVTLPILERSI
jgi:hypothetical protein